MIESLQQPLIGVDVGGTFTDFVLVWPDGRVSVRKHQSTPHDPAVGVLAGITAERTEGRLGPVFSLCHGTTVATNALLERRGAEIALITTRGFRDVLEIGRQARRSIYALEPQGSHPLLPRDRRFEVTERIDSRGNVISPLDEAGLIQTLGLIRDLGVESVAICFLFAHLNLTHERRAAAIARELGHHVSLSSDIAPEPREFERTSTVVANAFVSPIVSRYLRRLERSIRSEGLANLWVMQSNGGVLTAPEAGSHAIKTVLSGPAGGVIAASRIAANAGLNRVLTFDMGGTSTDVSLIVDGGCPVVTHSTLGDLPLRTPTLDIHTVGAGGGSQAWIDSAGALRVGPRSAGADPGPVAYGKSSVLTVTDANIFLGRLPDDLRLAGSVPLDVVRVKACFDVLALEVGRSPESLALGIVSIAEASMTRALRHISMERGHDPAGFALLSFGGAGGLHACAVATAMGIVKVVIPRFPGALSALGLAVAPIRHEFVRGFPAVVLDANPTAIAWTTIHDVVNALLSESARRIAAERRAEVRYETTLQLDVRYAGQSFELRVPFKPEDPTSAGSAFHRLNRQRYGHSDPRDPIEAVVVRCILEGTMPLPMLRYPVASKPSRPTGESMMRDGDAWIVASRYVRDDLAAGQEISCPALILQSDACTFIPKPWSAVVDEHGNLRLSRHCQRPQRVKPKNDA